MPTLALHSFSQEIEIPVSLRDQPVDMLHTSARLTSVLGRYGIRLLGDLHGRKVVDFAWEKNCGAKTLYELDLLARRARFRKGCASAKPGCSAESKAAAQGAQWDAGSFAIPDSVGHLSFDELPLTTRLANVVRCIGARSLGDLNGCNAFELLQYKACGWGMISEIQQLIERAVSGEFSAGPIEQKTVAAELVSLLEQGLAKLPLRDTQFVLARIGGATTSARSPSPNSVCLSHAEIGRRYGLTRARIHKVFVNTLDSLRKIWGPRVPRLLEVIKWRCLSTICPLTPELLGKWVGLSAISSFQPATRDALNSARLSMAAHLRLIAALDKSIPCWPEINRKPRSTHAPSQFDLALAHVVREAGGHITVAEAYRTLADRGSRRYRRMPVESFLQTLRSVECTVVEFNNPEIPIVRLRSLKPEGSAGDVSDQNGKPSTAGLFHSNPPVIELFRPKRPFCERHAIARR